jgi:hypothetical protein
MINALLQEGILLDEQTKNYQSNLNINPKFDFYGLLVESLRLQYFDFDKILEPFKHLIKNKKLKMHFDVDEDRNVQITLNPYGD